MDPNMEATSPFGAQRKNGQKENAAALLSAIQGTEKDHTPTSNTAPSTDQANENAMSDQERSISASWLFKNQQARKKKPFRLFKEPLDGLE